MASPAAGLEIVINGRFLAQRLTGVQRVAEEFTRAFDRLLAEGVFPRVRGRLVAPAHADVDRLALRCIAVEPVAGPRGHLWEQLVLPRHVRDGVLLCLGNSAPFATLWSRRPPAVMLHDQAYLRFPNDYSAAYRLFHRLNERAVIHRAQPLLLVSEAERDMIESRHPVARSRDMVAPNGSWRDDAKIVARSPDPPQPRYGLFVGAPSHRKNIAAVLATAIALARKRAHHFRLVGPNAEALRQALPADVARFIALSGYVSDDELPSLYRGAAYLLCPSFYEASGLPLTEAMTFGCPVVASDLPVMRERCGDVAIYCDPHDRRSIRTAVEHLLDDPVRAAELRRLGPLRAARFTWRQQARLIVEAIAQAHGRSAGEPSRRAA